MAFNKKLLLLPIIMALLGLGFVWGSADTSIADIKAEKENILHIYSSRHYDTDQKLYDDFTAQTGIQIQKVEGKDDALIARLEQEGKASPADVFITVDAGRLWRAQEAGLFTAVSSKILDKNIPAYLKSPTNHWFGFSKRARVIVYNKAKLQKDDIKSYADLTAPQWKDRICIRSASNIYNLSIMASFIALNGEQSAKEWAQGVLNNLARKPQGGDTDQIKAVAAGKCDIALVNSYYYFRLMRSEEESDRALSAQTDIIFPTKDVGGTHVNISGAGILTHSDNKAAAQKFLEYLSTPSAQAYFAEGNNEYPVVKGAALPEILKNYKMFDVQDINVEKFGTHQKEAQMIFDKIKFP